MLRMHEIREIMKVVNKSSLDEFTWVNEGIRISMKKQCIPLESKPELKPVATVDSTQVQEKIDSCQLPEEEQPSTEIYKIVSPVIGVFHSSLDIEGNQPVEVGDLIQPDTIVCTCVVEALRLTHQIKSEVSGEIAEILVKDGQLVEYGQPLYLIKSK